jgi:hypothetical protein
MSPFSFNDWMKWVNQPMTDAELIRLRRSLNRGAPFGSDAWSRQLEHATNRHMRVPL